MKAHEFLKAGIQHMEDRAATYDKPEGERSIPATVAAFNALTGHKLTDEQGWLFIALVKAARAQSGGEFKADNFEDGAAYFALMGEAAYQRWKLGIDMESKKAIDPMAVFEWEDKYRFAVCDQSGFIWGVEANDGSIPYVFESRIWTIGSKVATFTLSHASAGAEWAAQNWKKSLRENQKYLDDPAMLSAGDVVSWRDEECLVRDVAVTIPHEDQPKFNICIEHIEHIEHDHSFYVEVTGKLSSSEHDHSFYVEVTGQLSSSEMKLISRHWEK